MEESQNRLTERTHTTKVYLNRLLKRRRFFYGFMSKTKIENEKQKLMKEVFTMGYIGNKWSVNAQRARGNGRYPLSVLAKRIGVRSEIIRSVSVPTEWHHTGRFKNASGRWCCRCTDYFDELEVKKDIFDAFMKGDIKLTKRKSKLNQVIAEQFCLFPFIVLEEMTESYRYIKRAEEIQQNERISKESNAAAWPAILFMDQKRREMELERQRKHQEFMMKMAKRNRKTSALVKEYLLSKGWSIRTQSKSKLREAHQFAKSQIAECI